MAEVPGQAMWDEWFDGQYDLSLCVDRAVQSLGEGKPELFKAALYAGVIEHCAEQLRHNIDFKDFEDQPVVAGSVAEAMDLSRVTVGGELVPAGRVTCYWHEPHHRETDHRDPDGCGWRTLHKFQPEAGA